MSHPEAQTAILAWIKPSPTGGRMDFSEIMLTVSEWIKKIVRLLQPGLPQKLRRLF
jgi:hypothetical protein